MLQKTAEKIFKNLFKISLKEYKVYFQQYMKHNCYLNLRLYGTCTRGLLINFNVKRLVEGIRRMRI